MDIAIQADHRVKLKESEKRYKYLILARELIKLQNMKMKVIPVVIDVFSIVSQRVRKGTGKCGNKKTSRDLLNYSIIKINHNTEKSPGDLRSF